MLDLGNMVTLDHNVSSRPVNHDLLLRQTQQLPQLIPQNLRLAIHLLYTRHEPATAALPQSIEGKVVAGGPGDEVGQVRGAEVVR